MYQTKDGKYLSRVGQRSTPARVLWDNLNRRLNTLVHYQNVQLGWDNFQDFARWFYKHHIPGYQLDKDINSRILEVPPAYSESCCRFVPKLINNFPCSHARASGAYLQGVCWVTEKELFKAQISKGNGKSRTIGYFTCEFEASRAYIKAKKIWGYELASRYPKLKTWFRKYVRLYCQDLEQLTYEKESEVNYSHSL